MKIIDGKALASSLRAKLKEKIERVENFDSINKEYYSDTRIRN